MSVVVCTNNRAWLLANVLQSLSRQTLDASDFEVIVVDNNSTDDTRAVTEEFCQRRPNLHYCFEGQQGLSYARNRGWHVARGRYVAYIDDDCEAPAEWLAVAREIIDARAPAAFGGPFRRIYATRKSAWFKDSYLIREPDPRPQTVTFDGPPAIYGGNLFILRELLERIGGFDPSLGMHGNSVAYGEEMPVLWSIGERAPGRVYYDPQLYVYELIRFEKTTLRYSVREAFARGRSAYRLWGGAHSAKGRFQLLVEGMRLFARVTIDVVRGVLSRDREQYPYLQNYLYERTLEIVRRLGRCYEQYQQRAGRQVVNWSGPPRSGANKTISMGM